MALFQTSRRSLVLLVLVALVVASICPAHSIAIPLTSASSYPGGSYGAESQSSYGSYPSAYKVAKSYTPYSGALTSPSMHSAMPYSSQYTSSYTSPYTSAYPYGSMSSMPNMGSMGSYYDQMPAYETAIDVHGAGFY